VNPLEHERTVGRRGWILRTLRPRGLRGEQRCDENEKRLHVLPPLHHCRERLMLTVDASPGLTVMSD
jgi:hypothetical protein